MMCIVSVEEDEELKRWQEWQGVTWVWQPSRYRGQIWSSFFHYLHIYVNNHDSDKGPEMVIKELLHALENGFRDIEFTHRYWDLYSTDDPRNTRWEDGSLKQVREYFRQERYYTKAYRLIRRKNLSDEMLEQLRLIINKRMVYRGFGSEFHPTIEIMFEWAEFEREHIRRLIQKNQYTTYQVQYPE